MNEIKDFLAAVEANALNPTAVEGKLLQFRTNMDMFIAGLLALAQ